jgi:hypothetical protein
MNLFYLANIRIPSERAHAIQIAPMRHVYSLMQPALAHYC